MPNNKTIPEQQNPKAYMATKIAEYKFTDYCGWEAILRLKTWGIGGLIVMGMALSGCSKDDANPNIPSGPDPIEKPEPTPVATKILVSSVDEWENAEKQISKKPGKYYIVKAIRDMEVDINNIKKMSAVGKLEKLPNVTVDWTIDNTDDNTERAGGTTYVVIPVGQIPLSFESYKGYGSFPLGKSDRGTVIIPQEDVEKFKDVRVEHVKGYNGENIYIPSAGQLKIWLEVLGVERDETRVGDTEKLINMTFTQKLSNGLGLVATDLYMGDIKKAINIANITNLRLQAGDPRVSNTAGILEQVEIVTNGKFNNDEKSGVSRLFYVTHQNGAKRFEGKGTVIATDTVHFAGENRFTTFVPEIAYVTATNTKADVIRSLNGYKGVPVELESTYNPDMPGGQNSFENYTNETLELMSSPIVNNQNAVVKWNSVPTVTSFTKKGTTPTAETFKKSISLGSIEHGKGSHSAEHLVAGNLIVGDEWTSVVNTSDPNGILPISCKDKMAHEPFIWALIYEFKDPNKYNQHTHNGNALYYTIERSTVIFQDDLTSATAKEFLRILSATILHDPEDIIISPAKLIPDPEININGYNQKQSLTNAQMKIIQAQIDKNGANQVL